YLWTNDTPCRYDKTVDNRHRPDGKAIEDPRWNRDKSVWPAPLILLVLALLSRETAIIFPFLFMVFYISFISRERFIRSLKQSFVKALPYFSIVFVYGILRLTVLNFDNTLNFYSKANLYTESFLVRMYTFLNVLLTYAKLLVLPLGQHMERSVTIYTHFWNLPVVSSFAILMAILMILRYLYKKENPKHEARNFKQVSNFEFRISNFRILLFGFGWFFVNLGPTSGITPINAQLYEHWLYLAMLGPIILAVYYLDTFRKRHLKVVNVAVVFILLIFVSFFSVLSVKRNILWGSPIRFFEDILKYEPDGARINNNLGNLYYDKGEKEKAEEYYWKAVSIEDNFPQPHFNLGSILQSRNDIRGAIVEFEKAIEIDSNFPYAYQNLAIIYAGQGDLVNAAKVLEKLKTITPYNPQIYYNLALIYLERKDSETAYQNLQEGLKYGQFDPETEALIQDLLKRFKK
ncbi:MAG: tetratricopeptide repeat protein, partial [Patescibacteria group bacterium]